MPQAELAPGTLVRYDETTTRWFVATVRSVEDDTVTLEYLGGNREEVNHVATALRRHRIRDLMVGASVFKVS